MFHPALLYVHATHVDSKTLSRYELGILYESRVSNRSGNVTVISTTTIIS